MANGTVSVTATQTQVNIAGVTPATRVSFEVRYHFAPDGTDYDTFALYKDSDDQGAVDLTIPLGTDFWTQETGRTVLFADGPWFTGQGGLLVNI